MRRCGHVRRASRSSVRRTGTCMSGLSPTGKVDHVEIDPVASEVIREVARRILADETGKITCATEAARLNREGIPSPVGPACPVVRRGR